MSDHAMDYDRIVAMAKEQCCQVTLLLAESQAADPFYAGAPSSKVAGEWFAALWRSHAFPTGTHIRRIHYRLVSLKKPPRLPDGTGYENTERCWEFLNNASRYARHLALVDPMAFKDQRNPQPHLFAQYEEVPQPQWSVGEVESWRLPEIATDVGLGLDFSLPEPEVSGYEGVQADQPFHLELWIEKSTMNDVLIPVCRSLGMNLVTAVGFQSITGAVRLIERMQQIEEIIGRSQAVRIFYISDFDPAGNIMPVTVSRHIEFYLPRYLPGADVKLIHLALTKEQVIEYQLPRTPIKEKDRRRAGFEDRYGEGAVELDALETLYPGTLARIVREAAEPYRDDDIGTLLDEAETEAQEAVAEAWEEATEEARGERDEILEEVEEIYKPYREKLKELNAELKQELAPLQDRLDGVRRAVVEKTNSLKVELPDRPTSDLEPPEEEQQCLFCSDRDYLEQLEFYHAHKPPWRRKQKLEHAVVCAGCGETFMTKQDRTTTCSDRCYERVRRAQRKAERPPPAEVRCQVCGDRFVPYRTKHKICAKASCQAQKRKARNAKNYRRKKESRKKGGKGKRRR
jgi:hypothetical protein